MRNPDQFEIPTRPVMHRVDPELIDRQPSMSKALLLCQTLSGKGDQQFIGASGVVKDQAQWSRIMSAGQHNFPHDKLNLFMDLAGNEAPLLWLAHSRGYDIESMRQRETETEQRNRVLREELAAERLKNRVLVEALHGRQA